MAFEIQQAHFEHGEQTDGTRADNDDIRFDESSAHVDFTPNFV